MMVLFWTLVALLAAVLLLAEWASREACRNEDNMNLIARVLQEREDA